MRPSDMTTSQDGINLIAEFEGFVSRAYPDPATNGPPWTIGYGRAHGVSPGMTCTREQALEWLREDVKEAENAVKKNVVVDLTQGQFDALVSAVFNLGPIS